MKYAPSGMAVAKFTLATNFRVKDADGNWGDEVEWNSCTAFQRTAEIIGEYVKKGNPLYIEGHLKTSSWEDKESGQKRYRTEVIVDQVVLLGKKGDRDDGDASSSKYEKAVERTEITDEDIPF
jgi:single-strand DNA-binding protein